MPRTEYGVIGSRTLVQILSPPGNHRGPEIFWSKRKKEDRRFQGIGFRGGDAFQVITDTLSRGVGKQGKLFIAKLANFLPFRIGLLFKLRCFGRNELSRLYLRCSELTLSRSEACLKLCNLNGEQGNFKAEEDSSRVQFLDFSIQCVRLL